MSLRLISLQYKENVHKQRIIGWAHGRPVWSISGGAPDDDSGSSGASSSGSEGTAEEEDKDESDDKKDESKTGNEVVTREEFDKLFQRMQAADRAKTAAEQRVKEYEDKDKTELEREKARADEAEAKLAQAAGALRDQAIRLAFLSVSSDVTWHDPEDALAFAMRDDSLRDLEVKDDGTVDRNVVKSVVSSLTKSKPYLVKKSGGTSADDDSGPSGHHPQGDNGKKDNLAKDKLLEKYPALRR